MSPTDNCNNNNIEYEHADNNDQLATNLSLDETVSSSIYIGDINETQSSENCGSAITGDENNDLRDDSESSESESNSQKDEGGDNDSSNSDNEIDNESTTSWTSFDEMPRSSNFSSPTFTSS